MPDIPKPNPPEPAVFEEIPHDTRSCSALPPRSRSALSPEHAPHWRRPQGVAEGTWDYVNDRSIADRYDAFVADTPLCRLDEAILAKVLPGCTGAERSVVLDLGCGSGRSAFPLASRGYDVVAIDLSQAMLRVLRNKSQQDSGPHQNPGLCQVSGRVMPLRANLVQLECLADASADHAVCLFSTLGMIQGRVHRRQMLRHVHRIVRPGGQLLAHVHHRWAALREYRGVRLLLRSRWQSLWHHEHEFGDTVYAYRGLEKMFMHRFSERELRADLTACGWQINSLWPVAIDGNSIVSRWSIPGGFFVLATA